MTPRRFFLALFPLAAASWLALGLYILAVHFLLTHDALPAALLCALAVGAYLNETRKERE